MAVLGIAGCGDKNVPQETPKDGASSIYTQGTTELPRKEAEGEPEFFITEDDEGNTVIVPNTHDDGTTDDGGEILDGTAEDHMMVDDNGNNAEPESLEP